MCRSGCLLEWAALRVKETYGVSSEERQFQLASALVAVLSALLASGSGNRPVLFLHPPNDRLRLLFLCFFVCFFCFVSVSIIVSVQVFGSVELDRTGTNFAC